MFRLNSNIRLKLLSFAFPLLLSIMLFSCSCHRKDSINHYGNDLDTLKVVTLYGPTSYFDYRGEPMGIDYENVRRFAEEEGMELEVSVVTNMQELISKLKNGEAHLAAYPVPFISEYKENILHCGPVEVSNQVLVQRKNDTIITDVTELVGKDIYVEKDSKYYYRILNLNDEIGGGINVIPIVSDTIDSEDWLRMVRDGNIPFTVVDSQIATLYKNAFPELELSLKLSSEQAASWAVACGLDSLAAKIDRWENQTHTSEFVKDIYKRYYDKTSSDSFDSNLSYFRKLNLSPGKNVSNYDLFFKKYAGVSGYDWRLLAAIAYCESRFNPDVESRFGAYGLMQVMPSSALAVGVDSNNLRNPESNVLAAAKIISTMDKALKNKVDDPLERMKFVIASYNSGLGHVYDSIALAKKHGLDPQKWTGNVSISALMKSRPEYYNDPVVKNGYFRGRETVDFVDHVMTIYNYLQEKLP